MHINLIIIIKEEKSFRLKQTKQVMNKRAICEKIVVKSFQFQLSKVGAKEAEGLLIQYIIVFPFDY
ncbi:MAG TPA: hypothetical protein DDW50_12125 [Firmicutes bacterium]|jgi:hypothetical protein|nr:hypothetical protein [Bacillota bacterium]